MPFAPLPRTGNQAALAADSKVTAQQLVWRSATAPSRDPLVDGHRTPPGYTSAPPLLLHGGIDTAAGSAERGMYGLFDCADGLFRVLQSDLFGRSQDPSLKLRIGRSRRVNQFGAHALLDLGASLNTSGLRPFSKNIIRLSL